MDDRWAAAAALVDATRRALFDYVRRQGHPVSREAAAAAQGMSRGLAAFHLDKLVEAGLLRARYEAPPDRPRGRGRAPKVYELASDGLSVTIPERRYQLIAEILAAAIEEAPRRGWRAGRDETDVIGVARRHAHRQGRDLGAELRQSDLMTVLAGLGFEPYPAEDGLRLANCPFHALAARYTALVCGLNQAFVSGVVDGLAATGVRADLVPRPGACCVTLTSTR